MDSEAANLGGSPIVAEVTILHLSDVHFGSAHSPAAASALVRFAHRKRPSAVVVSGDLTQRAKVREYRAARAFLDGLAEYPVVVTAGNHDVPLYRFGERILAPFRNYRRHIQPALDTVTDVAPGPGDDRGARFVALNSTSPRTGLVNGRLRRRQLELAERSFGDAPPGFLRVLVAHHNLIAPEDGSYGTPLRRAGRVLDALPGWGVDMVLGGHVHRATLAESGAGVPVLLAGTATSTRGRGPERGRSSFNWIHVRSDGIEVEVHFFSGEAGFRPEWGRSFGAP